MNKFLTRPAYLLRSSVLGSCMLMLTLFAVSACNFGQAQPTAVPFAATPYAAVEGQAAPANDAATTAVTTTTASNTGSTAETATNNTADSGTASTANEATGSAPLAGVLRYNGEIAAEKQVVVVAETAGMVLQLDLEIGAQVEQGDLIAQLDTTLLEAQKAQAMAGLAAVNAQLDLIQVAPDEDDLEAARAGVAAAAAAYQRASAGPTAEDQRLALAQLKQAQAGVTVAQAGYNLVKGNPAIGALPQSLQLQAATIGLEAAQAQYDKILKGATQDVIAGAYAQLAQARAQLQRLQEGAKPEQIEAVKAQVRQAEMGVYLSQLQMSKATVKAPVAGIVSRVNSAQGAMAGPGAPLVTLLSREVKITIAVEEARLSQIQIGMPATIRVDAYPELTFDGEVAIIAPELDAGTRTVQVTLRPTGDASVLSPGMFATVELAIGN